MEPVKLNKLIGKTEYTEREKQMGCAVKDLYVFLFDRKHKNWRKAMDLLGPCYVQHNPMIPDGRQGLLDWAALLRKKGIRFQFYQMAIDGDYVFVRFKLVRKHGKDPGRAGVDLFRFEKGKIVEHWDVIQEIPAVSLNGNSMF